MMRYILATVPRISLGLFGRQAFVIVKTALKKYMSQVKKTRNAITVGQLLDIISNLTFTSISYPKILIGR